MGEIYLSLLETYMILCLPKQGKGIEIDMGFEKKK